MLVSIFPNEVNNKILFALMAPQKLVPQLLLPFSEFLRVQIRKMSPIRVRKRPKIVGKVICKLSTREDLNGLNGVK